MFIAELSWYKKLSRLRSLSLAKKVGKYIKNNTLLLDFGCGNMFTAKELVSLNPTLKIVGLDIVADQNLNLSNNNNQLSFVQSGSQILPFEDKSFKEISLLTGVSVNTLLSRKRYAILFLRKKLQELYNEL